MKHDMIPKIIHWCWFGQNKPSEIANRCLASWKKFLPDYKIIHYCWFGPKPLPKLAKKCIDSWKKIYPDYEIKLWNEQNFDINCCQYVKQAYLAKKYAFVTDYVRLYALYHDGGIYMDSDVEVLKNIDIFLDNVAFSGYESYGNCLTGIIGSIQNGKFVKDLLDEYTDRQFILDNGKLCSCGFDNLIKIWD